MTTDRHPDRQARGGCRGGAWTATGRGGSVDGMSLLRFRLRELLMLVAIVALSLGLVAQRRETNALRRRVEDLALGYSQQKELHALLMAGKMRAEAELAATRKKEHSL